MSIFHSTSVISGMLIADLAKQHWAIAEKLEPILVFVKFFSAKIPDIRARWNTDAEAVKCHRRTFG